MRTAVVYHYFELNETYKDNFIFFLECGVDATADYFIYISGHHTVDLPTHENVNYFYIKNENNDLGSIIEFSKLRVSYTFDAYVFVNCSVRGPFFPTYYTQAWHKAFTSRLDNNIAMVGSSINLLPESFPSSIKFSRNEGYKAPFIHVQTYAYAISKEAFEILRSRSFFDISGPLPKDEIIQRYEIAISQEILREGFALSSLLQTQNCFTDDNRNVNYQTTALSGDPAFRSAFYGRSISPFENIFIKTNRNALTNVELASYTFSSLEEKKLQKFLSSQGTDLLERSHSFTIEHGRKFTITLNDLTNVLSQIKTGNPALANQLRGLL